MFPSWFNELRELAGNARSRGEMRVLTYIFRWSSESVSRMSGHIFEYALSTTATPMNVRLWTKIIP
jgi:hypothetical protein